MYLGHPYYLWFTIQTTHHEFKSHPNTKLHKSKSCKRNNIQSVIKVRRDDFGGLTVIDLNEEEVWMTSKTNILGLESTRQLLGRLYKKISRLVLFVSLLLPTLPKLPSQCYSNGPGNLAGWAAMKKYSHSFYFNCFKVLKIFPLCLSS